MNLPDFALERYFARYEFDLPYLLSSSDIEPYELGELLELADGESRELWDGLSLGYTESAGHPLLREEISGMYERAGAEDILVFAGAEEAIFAYMNVVLEAGDRVAATCPAYQSLHEVARSAGAEVAPLALRHEDGWRLDVEELRGHARPAKAVVVNFPHNPTGALPERDTFEEVVEIARESGSRLFSDEVYRLLEHDPADRLPAAADLYEGAASLGVMSKAFALAGLRIGWIYTKDRELMRRLSSFKDYTTICNSAPSEILSLVALRAREAVLERNMRIISENLRHADRFFADNAGIVEWVRPRVGCIGFPKLLHGPTTEELATGMAEEGMMLLPGEVYEYPGHFRLGLGRRNFPEALQRLEGFLERKIRG